MHKHKQIRIFSGSSNQPLATKIAAELGADLLELHCKTFSSGEMFFQFPESIKDKQVVLIQTISSPINDNLMELFLLCDTFKNAGACEVIAVVPYLGYSRQDKPFGKHSCSVLQLIAKLLATARLDKLIVLELHSLLSLNLFAMPVIHLSSQILAAQYIRNQNLNNIVLVSPDNGGTHRVERLARELSVPYAHMDKKRINEGKVTLSLIKGRVAKRDCIIIDDIVDSADTLCAVATFLSENGAKSIKAFITHGVLSAGAVERIVNSNVTELVITDSIFWANELVFANIIKIQTIAPLIANAIRSFLSNN